MMPGERGMGVSPADGAVGFSYRYACHITISMSSSSSRHNRLRVQYTCEIIPSLILYT